MTGTVIEGNKIQVDKFEPVQLWADTEQAMEACNKINATYRYMGSREWIIPICDRPFVKAAREKLDKQSELTDTFWTREQLWEQVEIEKLKVFPVNARVEFELGNFGAVFKKYV